jgi:hypothetical protein
MSITFEQYLQYRGFETPVISPWPFLKRGFIDAWFEPGFHRFWRVWNPPFSYVTYVIYRFLGGKRSMLLSTLLTFMLCGFLLHDIFGLVFEQVIGFRNTLVFLFFGLFTLLSRRLEGPMGQGGWPRFCNLLLNAALIWTSFVAGTSVNEWLLPGGRIPL